MILIDKIPLRVDKFPNNELRPRDIIFNDKMIIDLKYESSDDLIALLLVKDEIDARGLESEIYIRYMPYSRMDREFKNDCFSLRAICRFINNLGFKQVHVVEAHSDVTTKLLNDVNPIYPMEDLITQVKEAINFNELDHIVYPDDGAKKRYGKVFNDNLILCEKRRDENTSELDYLKIIEGNVNKNSKCIIIDDLCASGGTCVRAAKALKDAGASEVYVLVVHTENQSLHKDIILNNLVDGIFTTDSIITEQHPKVNILQFNKEKYMKKRILC